jgi:clan AA aspartic protease
VVLAGRHAEEKDGRMGTTRVTVTLKDLRSRRVAYQADFVVDTGATDCVVPASALRRAGVIPVEKMTYELADGSLHQYDIGVVQIEFMGSITAGRVVFGAEDIEPILGVTALESVGVIVDPVKKELRRLPAIPLRRAAAAASCAVSATA